MIGPIQERTLTLATYATKTSVAETSLHKVLCFLILNENEIFWSKYLIGPIQERTLTRATFATKPSVNDTAIKWWVFSVF